jgi:hypothetical protein
MCFCELLVDSVALVLGGEEPAQRKRMSATAQRHAVGRTKPFPAACFPDSLPTFKQAPFPLLLLI